MSERNDGGPAFPTVAGHTVYSHGMYLRDYFAGQALTAVAIQAFDDESTVEANARIAAVWAYAVADAMLEARK